MECKNRVKGKDPLLTTSRQKPFLFCYEGLVFAALYWAYPTTPRTLVVVSLLLIPGKISCTVALGVFWCV